jgi:hypothetical protein
MIPTYLVNGVRVTGHPPDAERLRHLTQRANLELSFNPAPAKVPVHSSMMGLCTGSFHNRPRTQSAYGKPVGRPSRPVRDVKSGRRWKDAKVAGTALGLSAETVRWQCMGNAKRLIDGEAVRAYADVVLVWAVEEKVVA